MALADQSNDRTWRQRAACRGADTNLWFPDARGEGQLLYVVARTICNTCPVKKACLDYALAECIDIGMWGGTSPDERRKIGFARALGICDICREAYQPLSNRQRFCSNDCRREAKSRLTRLTRST